MSEFVDTEKAKKILDKNIKDAERILGNPDELNAVLEQVSEKLKNAPVIGNAIHDLPIMVGMVRGYITGTYKNVSPKVIASIVGSFLYFVKRKDLIPDSIPVIGVLDDLAVFALALQLVQPELKEFSAWAAKEKPEGQDPAQAA